MVSYVYKNHIDVFTYITMYLDSLASTSRKTKALKFCVCPSICIKQTIG